MTYFRNFPSAEDPHLLLRPEEHVSTPWGSFDHGPCDKCGQTGAVTFGCRSCMETGPRSECPACQGRVEFVAECPTCGGTSEISDTARAGVSVFPTIEGLYRYLVERDTELDDSVIVELEGSLSDELDLDADSGALLVHPTELVTRHEIDEERVADLRRRLEESGADPS